MSVLRTLIHVIRYGKVLVKRNSEKCPGALRSDIELAREARRAVFRQIARKSRNLDHNPIKSEWIMV
jgi:hypothetical protein